MAPTQDNRPLRVTTGLGKDALLLERFTGDESVSAPFRFTLEMLSENHAVDPAAVLRKPILVTAIIPGGEKRVFHGVVSRFSAGGRRASLTTYRAEMVPWLWFLSLTADCRIFQNMAVSDIVTKVFKDAGFNDFKFKLMGSPAKRVYCVQYRETNLAFISRLLEEEGIFYFFEHTASKHTLVLTDHPSQVPACPGVSKIRVTASQSWQMAEEPLVTGVEMETSAVTERIELTDYDFEKPSSSLYVKASGDQKDEEYDFPGNYTVKADGERFARLRLEQKESERQLLHGESNAPSLTSGHKFDLTEHSNRSLNASYHVLRVRHTAAISNYVTGDGEYEYGNTFDAIPASVPYRPPLATPKAVVRGSQTAVVVGPAGEEIYVDKFGRVKVQFHWDRQGKKDQNSSCWVRVSSAWAGKNWGFIQIPRMGQEVIVDFLEGDPDDPIITGRVYNAEQVPPYDLPANMTQSGILTRSSKGGTAANANQLRFEDKKGSEQLYMHAEKNQDIEVEANETHWVGHDRTKTIDHDETSHIKHDRTETVDNDESITIGGYRTENVSKDETISITGNRTESVGKDEGISISGNRAESVGKNESISISGNRSETVAKDETVAVQGKRAVAISKDDALEVQGARSVKIAKDDVLEVGKKLVINVADEISLKTGDAVIVMKKNGDITIKGKNITLQGSGKITGKADGDVVLKGSKVTAN
ncbi:MAG TPA: type VI secretion system tip protein TssI/VgrG [Gemmatimonadaceae bacterium]|nr:type VI secretion system tip protein TssI/VgrG [Gemmatimonadaceae bacterium]